MAIGVKSLWRTLTIGPYRLMLGPSVSTWSGKCLLICRDNTVVFRLI